LGLEVKAAHTAEEAAAAVLAAAAAAAPGRLRVSQRHAPQARAWPLGVAVAAAAAAAAAHAQLGAAAQA